MKATVLIGFMLIAAFVKSEDASYTGSTPAGETIRTFLGISNAKAIDFIRWKLKITDQAQFALSCSYGISKANTNGFTDEKHVEFSGTVNASNGVLSLSHNNRSLSVLILNKNILHILEKDGSMMTGNDGWSYTLNSITPVQTTEINLKEADTDFKDSVVFAGRTPCREVEELMIEKLRPECYKKKWLVTLYKETASSGTYTIKRDRKGKWKLKNDKSGRIIYSLDLNNGNTLDLLHADEKVIYILDRKGNILVGDHDFSYSLNRR